jgi:hypothetical protein
MGKFQVYGVGLLAILDIMLDNYKGKYFGGFLV